MEAGHGWDPMSMQMARHVYFLPTAWDSARHMPRKPRSFVQQIPKSFKHLSLSLQASN